MSDIWAPWLLERRFGGDSAIRDRWLQVLVPLRDRVLERAELEPDDVVLDVGTGDGLVAFAALERLAAAGRVIFADVSDELLSVCGSIAADLGAGNRTSFVHAAAEDLAPIADAAVDVVTTRSVLIYVEEKAAAFAEFFRVLRPGGRMSLCEPINRYFGLRPPPGEWWGGYDVRAVVDLAARVQAVYEKAQPATSAMMDFDDRDLVRFAEDAGFNPIDLELNVEVVRGEALHRTWKEFLHVAPNPHAPTLAEAVDAALSPDEAQRLLDHLRAEVEAGDGTKRLAHAFLAARKPRP